MNLAILALRRPYAVVAAVLAVALAAGLALPRLRIDALPELDVPVILVCLSYSGMDPVQMEGLLTSHLEEEFLQLPGIQQVDSRNVHGLALLALRFQPGTNMVRAQAETMAAANRARVRMPAGTVPPVVMPFDSGLAPLGYLVLTSDTKTIGDLHDLAQHRVRPLLGSLPGVAAAAPFGGSPRTIVCNIDPDRLRAYQLTAEDVLSALAAGNTSSPSGNLRLQDQLAIVPFNSLVLDPKDLGNIPVRKGESVLLRDLGTIEDGNDHIAGHALVNGRRAVYLPISREGGASTLAVIDEVKSNLAKVQAVLPDDIQVSLELDQSRTLTSPLWSAGITSVLGLIGAGLVVLLFMRSLPAALIVMLNILAALLATIVALWLTNQSLNLMTLGGLVLAVGILLNDALIGIDNVQVQRTRTSSLTRAVILSGAELAGPRLGALLCVLALLGPAFLMDGAARALLVPLALTAGCAALASYILSSMFLPVLATALGPVATASPRWPLFAHTRVQYVRLLQQMQRLRWLLAVACLAAPIGLALWWAAGHPALATTVLPLADARQFQVRLRAATGTHADRTEELALQALDIIKDLAGAENVSGSIGYAGLMSPNYPANSAYLWTTGPEEAVLRVALKPDSGMRLDDLQNRLRVELPRRLSAWLRHKLQGEGLPDARIAERLRGLRLSFDSTDRASEALGAATPVEVRVSGPKLGDCRAYAERLLKQLEQIPALRDLQVVQAFDYPTLAVQLDRDRASQSGATAGEVARALTIAASSSRLLMPNLWHDPNSGISYQVQVQIPSRLLPTARALELLPVARPGSGLLLLRDVAQIEAGTMPGAVDRHNQQRTVNLIANVQGEDLGLVVDQIGRAIAAIADPPRGVNVDVRGQVQTWQQLYKALARGLAVAGVVLILVLLATFHSIRLALLALATVPMTLAAAAAALALTHTSLNVESVIGTLLAVTVALTNAVLLIALTERQRRAGMSATPAALEAATQRLRPCLMTTLALLVPLTPLALALGPAGERGAPLARAAIGGLLAATLTSLLVVPTLLAYTPGGRNRDDGERGTLVPRLSPGQPGD